METMQFGLSESQQILKNNARKFFAAECPMAEVRRIWKPTRRTTKNCGEHMAEQGFLGVRDSGRRGRHGAGNGGTGGAGRGNGPRAGARARFFRLCWPGRRFTRRDRPGTSPRSPTGESRPRWRCSKRARTGTRMRSQMPALDRRKDVRAGCGDRGCYRRRGARWRASWRCIWWRAKAVADDAHARRWI